MFNLATIAADSTNRIHDSGFQAGEFIAHCKFKRLGQFEESPRQLPSLAIQVHSRNQTRLESIRLGRFAIVAVLSS